VEHAFYLDLRLTYGFEIGSGAEIEAFAAVTNLTDQDPPKTPYYSTFGAHSIQTNSVLFDLLGRRYTVGVRLAL
jgi:iron complex outermembrane recepter protein